MKHQERGSVTASFPHPYGGGVNEEVHRSSFQPAEHLLSCLTCREDRGYLWGRERMRKCFVVEASSWLFTPGSIVIAIRSHRQPQIKEPPLIRGRPH